MKPAVIFDLDQTLLDTSTIEHLRKPGKWTTAVANLHTLTPFNGINEILTLLTANNVEVVIITTSPEIYCKAIIKHFKWNITGHVCYHDVKRIKPDPEAFLKAINDYHLDVSRTISVGDRNIDILASTAAKIPSVACPWASPNSSALLAAKPTYLAQSPTELFDIIKKFFNLESH